MFVQWISEKDEVAPLATGGIRNLELGRKCLSIHDGDEITQLQVSKLPSSMFVHPNSRGLLITCHLVHRQWQQVQLISFQQVSQRRVVLNLVQSEPVLAIEIPQLRSWKSREGSLQSQRWLWRKDRGIGAEVCSKSEDCNKIATTTLRDPPESSNQASQPEGQTEIQTKEERREREREKELRFGELLTFSDT